MVIMVSVLEDQQTPLALGEVHLRGPRNTYVRRTDQIEILHVAGQPDLDGAAGGRARRCDRAASKSGYGQDLCRHGIDGRHVDQTRKDRDPSRR